MTTYRDLDWDSINFLKSQLYRRLASALNNALGRLAIARHVDGDRLVPEQVEHVERWLEMALTLVRAWAALVHVASGGTIDNMQRRHLAPHAIPEWLRRQLAMQTSVTWGHTHPINVHPEAFYESLLLLTDLGDRAGGLRSITTGDARGDQDGIWIRAVFVPVEGNAYTGLRQLGTEAKTTRLRDETDTAFLIEALRTMGELNGARLTLQNNVRTGEQALSMWYPAAPAEGPRRRVSVTGMLAAAQEPDTPANGKTARLPAAAGSQPDPAEAESGSEFAPAENGFVENASETLLLAPPNRQERLAAAVASHTGSFRAEAADPQAAPVHKRL